MSSATSKSPFQLPFSPVTPFSGHDAFPEQKEQESKWKERNDRQLRYVFPIVFVLLITVLQTVGC